MAEFEAVLSFRKGLRRCYGLVLKNSARGRPVLLLQGESIPRTVPDFDRSKYRTECVFDCTSSSVGLRSRSEEVERHLGLGSNYRLEVAGLDRYPLVSPLGPVLFVLSCLSSEMWSIADVVPHLVGLAEGEPTRDGFSGVDRLFLDAARLGIAAEIESHVRIPDDRRTWLAALAFSAGGRHDEAIRACSSLPADSYPERNSLVAAAAQHFADPQGWAMSSAVINRSTPSGAVLAHVLCGAEIGRTNLRDGAAEVETWLWDRSARIENRGSLTLRRLLAADPAAFASSDAYKLAVALNQPPAAVVNLSGAALRMASDEMIDDLIDRKSLTAAHLSDLVAARPRQSVYLALRLDPEWLEKGRLVGLDAATELTRRQVLECLTSDSGSASGPGAVMVGLRDGHPASDSEIASLPEAWQEKARLLSGFLKTGDVRLAKVLAADPTLLPLLSDRLGDRLESLPRTGPLTDMGAQNQLKASLDALLDARWDDCLTTAKEVMRSTEREDLRDEALNLMACAHWQLGHDEMAIGALRSALEGEYNSALQTNIGVVAANLEPDVAVEHLGRLADEAPSARLRYAAAVRGLTLWSASTDDQLDVAVPHSLLSPLRSLARGNLTGGELTDDEFWTVLNSLAVHDSEWVKASLDTDPRLLHTRNHQVRVALARAEGPVEFVEAVGELEASTSAWCAEQRAMIVDLVLGIQASDPTSTFAAVMGMALVGTNIELPAGSAIRLRCFTVLGVCRAMEEGNEPSEEIQSYVGAAEGLMSSCTLEEQADLKPLVGHAGTALLLSVTSARATHLEQIAEMVNNLIVQVAGVPRRRLNMGALRNAVRPMQQMCTATIKDLKGLRKYSEEPELLDFVDSVTEMASQIEQRLKMFG